MPRPALAGAYLAALIAVSVALTGPSTRQLDEARWMSGTQRYAPVLLSAQLETAEQDTVSAMPGIRSGRDCFPARQPGHC